MATPSAYDLSGFRQGLKETGFIGWANDDPDRLPELAADLVKHRLAIDI
jgi:hypothetical protein